MPLRSFLQILGLAMLPGKRKPVCIAATLPCAFPFRKVRQIQGDAAGPTNSFLGQLEKILEALAGRIIFRNRLSKARRFNLVLKLMAASISNCRRSCAIPPAHRANLVRIQRRQDAAREYPDFAQAIHQFNVARGHAGRNTCSHGITTSGGRALNVSNPTVGGQSIMVIVILATAIGARRLIRRPGRAIRFRAARPIPAGRAASPPAICQVTSLNGCQAARNAQHIINAGGNLGIGHGQTDRTLGDPYHQQGVGQSARQAARCCTWSSRIHPFG